MVRFTATKISVLIKTTFFLLSLVDEFLKTSKILGLVKILNGWLLPFISQSFVWKYQGQYQFQGRKWFNWMRKHFHYKNNHLSIKITLGWIGNYPVTDAKNTLTVSPAERQDPAEKGIWLLD